MSFDRGAAIAWYRKNRARSRALFDLIADEAYYSQPIALRHPIVFYEGHLPAFSFNTLVKRALGRPGIDARLETLFARGIDPHESAPSAAAMGTSADPPQAEAARSLWPSRDEVHDLQLVAVLHHDPVERLAFDDDQVVLDGDAARVDLQLREKIVHGEGAGEVVRLAVQGNPQGRCSF